MRRFLAVTLLLTAFVAPPLIAQTRVGVTPDSLTVLVGSTVTLSFGVENVTNLHLYHVVVRFDNSVLRCTGISSGGFLPGTFFFHSPQILPSDTARFVTVDDALIGAQTRNGSGVFFTLEFSALETGSTEIALVEVVLRDAANQNISHSTAGGVVRVTPPGAAVGMDLARNWNLLCLPVLPADTRRTVLFPTAVSAAFRFRNGYVAAETLAAGVGYWVKFPAPEQVVLSGFTLMDDTVAVRAGWNMIGGLTAAVDTGAIQAVPPLEVLSSYFGFTPGVGYGAADTLRPGRGYWVKVSTDGGLLLRTGPPLRR